jgi:hypothetical protein
MIVSRYRFGKPDFTKPKKMSKGNKTPAKSNKPKLALSLKQKREHKDVKINIENRNHKRHIP